MVDLMKLPEPTSRSMPIAGLDDGTLISITSYHEQRQHMPIYPNMGSIIAGHEYLGSHYTMAVDIYTTKRLVRATLEWDAYTP